MKKLLLSSFLFASIMVQAQNKLPNRQLQVGAGISTYYFKGYGFHGRSFHGSYTEYFRPKFSWTAAIGGTMHHDEINFFYKDPVTAELRDGSIRQTVAGTQASGHIGYSAVRTPRHELLARLGAVARYQYSSQLKSAGIMLSGPSGVPVYNLTNFPEYKTFTIGASIQFAYNYTICNEWAIGGMAALQHDNKNAQVTDARLTVTRRF